jgi:hypothetical protein
MFVTMAQASDEAEPDSAVAGSLDGEDRDDADDGSQRAADDDAEHGGRGRYGGECAEYAAPVIVAGSDLQSCRVAGDDRGPGQAGEGDQEVGGPEPGQREG